MALMFAAATGLCLVAVTALAVQLDSSSRTAALRDEATARAGGLARAVWFDDGTLHLDPLAQDELAGGAYELEVLEADRTVLARPGGESAPSTTTAGMLADLVAEVEDTVQVRGPSRAGAPVQWAAAPVWDDDTLGAVVVVGVALEPSRTAHARLVGWLAAAVVALTGLATGAGYLLAGRAMRPAVQALDQRERFLAEAAHELRTPLAVLRLELEGAGPTPALHQVDRIDRLLHGLLTRARVESGSLRVAPVALRLDQLVEQSVAELAAADPRAALVEMVAEPVVVRADPDLLGQAVRNLVENALRYGEGSPVRVEVAPSGFTVVDGGPGLTRTRQRPTSRHGLGAGLAIVQWVATVHGGELVLSQAPGGGLAAHLSLPS